MFVIDTGLRRTVARGTELSRVSIGRDTVTGPGDGVGASGPGVGAPPGIAVASSVSVAACAVPAERAAAQSRAQSNNPPTAEKRWRSERMMDPRS